MNVGDVNITSIRLQFDGRLPFRHMDVTAANYDRYRHIPGDLQIEIETPIDVVTAGQVQHPGPALFLKPWMGGIVETVCIRLGAAANKFVNDAMDLAIRTGCYSDVATCDLHLD